MEEGSESDLSLQPSQNNFFSNLVVDFANQKKIQQQKIKQKVENFIQDENNIFQSSSLQEKVKKIQKKKGIKPKVIEKLEQKKQNNVIETKGLGFKDLGLIKPLIKACYDNNYTTPTPIQQQAIPIILKRKDVLANAVTGSGKTAAFLLPILQIFSTQQFHNYSKVLIIIPTRELAIQCYEVLQKLNCNTKLSSYLVIGATDIKRQQIELRRNPDIIICTPGRLIDLVKNSQAIDLDYIEVMIFDEADKLLELGFEAEIQEIIKNVNPQRQTLLFSATLNPSIQSLIKLAMKNPQKVQVDPDLSTARKLKQEIVKIKSNDLLFREAVLLCICSELYKDKVIVFFKTKKQCHRLAILFNLIGLKACELHGNLSQSQRTQAFDDFRNDKFDYLLATDLAARGLDIQDVQSVINFEIPIEIQRYIHRVGRTARAGKEGVSLSICDDNECKNLKKMIKRTGDKVFKKNMKEKFVKKYIKKINELERDVNEVIEKEAVERTLRKADQEAQKAQNMITFQDEIFNKPKKEWIVSKTQKENTNKRQRLELGLDEDEQQIQKKNFKKIKK